MKTSKFLFTLFLGAIALGFHSCSDDDDDSGNTTGNEAQSRPGAYVINQGNYYNGIDGTLGFIDEDSSSISDSLFIYANGQTLGGTPQNGIMYGSKLYIISYESNTLFVINRQTLKKEQIITINGPRDILAYGGRVYVSNYDGYVSRFDTLTYASDKIQVGPNPEQMTEANGYLYVVNSDGMNYVNNYSDGKSVSKINLTSFTEEKKIAVGLNPTKIASDTEGHVFLIASGDYYQVPSTLQKIDTNDEVSDIGGATLMAIKGTTLYAINSVTTDWTNYTNTYTSINTATGDTISTAFISQEDGVKYPSALAIHPSNGRIYIGSDGESPYGGPGYSAKGTVRVYTADGSLLFSTTCGVHPVSFFFSLP